MGDVQSEHIRQLMVEYVQLQQQHRQTQVIVVALAKKRQKVVQKIVDNSGGSRSEAARILGISATMVSRILSRGAQRRKVHKKRYGNTDTLP
jgi:DNA invertase Pin-like site-specific DNA recombinase